MFGCCPDVDRRIVQALQLSVPQIPEHQQQQLDALRQRWLDAVQCRSRSGELFLRDVARWLTGVGNVRRSEQSRNQQVCLYATTAACSITCYMMCGSLQGITGSVCFSLPNNLLDIAMYGCVNL